MIIDSHLHISYLGKPLPFLTIFKNLQAEMRINRITKAVVIPDNLSGSACADMETVAELISGKKQFVMVATAKVSELEEQIQSMEKLFHSGAAKGFKIFPGHDPVYPTDIRWQPILRLCQRYRRPFIIHTGVNSGNTKVAKYNDPKHIRKLALSFPKVNFIISHYFWPKLTYCFEQTQGVPNVAFDTSAMADPEVVRDSGGIRSIRSILVKTVKRDPKSVLYGSDWPIGKFKAHLDLVRSLPVSTSIRQAILANNARRIFRV